MCLDVPTTNTRNSIGVRCDPSGTPQQITLNQHLIYTFRKTTMRPWFVGSQYKLRAHQSLPLKTRINKGTTNIMHHPSKKILTNLNTSEPKYLTRYQLSNY